jgi:hypothetical protein
VLGFGLDHKRNFILLLILSNFINLVKNLNKIYVIKIVDDF